VSLSISRRRGEGLLSSFLDLCLLHAMLPFCISEAFWSPLIFFKDVGQRARRLSWAHESYRLCSDGTGLSKETIVHLLTLCRCSPSVPRYSSLLVVFTTEISAIISEASAYEIYRGMESCRRFGFGIDSGIENL
jgi:hypothetical protein